MTNQIRWLSNYSVSVMVALCVSVVPVDEAAGADVNLLFMGNSYTQYYALPAFVSSLAVADGYDAPLIVTDLEGGKNVAYHLGQVINNPQNNVADPSIAGSTFDFAILQDHSLGAGTGIVRPPCALFYRYHAWGMDASTNCAVFTLTMSCSSHTPVAK